MAFISEFTNEIYDQSTAAFHEEQDSTRVFLGILVTLLPKVSKFSFGQWKWVQIAFIIFGH